MAGRNPVVSPRRSIYIGVPRRDRAGMSPGSHVDSVALLARSFSKATLVTLKLGIVILP